MTKIVATLNLVHAVAVTPVDSQNRRVFPLELKRALCQAYKLAKHKGKFCKQVGIKQAQLSLWVSKHMNVHGFNAGSIVTRESIVNVIATEDLGGHKYKNELFEKQLSLL